MAPHNYYQTNKKTTSARAQGYKRELQARNYLEKQGLTHIISNYQCKSGEIDLIMEDHDKTLVFVEVRYRQHIDYGSGADSVIRRKQNRIIRTAKHYLQKNGLTDTKLCRFDVIAIDAKKDEQNLLWLKDAFWVKY